MSRKPSEKAPEKNGSEPEFPLRAAAIDMGSNAIRLLVAEFSNADKFTPLETVRAPVRLGHRLPAGCLDFRVNAAAVAHQAHLLDRAGCDEGAKLTCFQ